MSGGERRLEVQIGEHGEDAAVVVAVDGQVQLGEDAVDVFWQPPSPSRTVRRRSPHSSGPGPSTPAPLAPVVGDGVHRIRAPAFHQRGDDFRVEDPVSPPATRRTLSTNSRASATRSLQEISDRTLARGEQFTGVEEVLDILSLNTMTGKPGRALRAAIAARSPSSVKLGGRRTSSTAASTSGRSSARSSPSVPSSAATASQAYAVSSLLSPSPKKRVLGDDRSAWHLQGHDGRPAIGLDRSMVPSKVPRRRAIPRSPVPACRSAPRPSSPTTARSVLPRAATQSRRSGAGVLGDIGQALGDREIDGRFDGAGGRAGSAASTVTGMAMSKASAWTAPTRPRSARTGGCMPRTTERKSPSAAPTRAPPGAVGGPAAGSVRASRPPCRGSLQATSRAWAPSCRSRSILRGWPRRRRCRRERRSDRRRAARAGRWHRLQNGRLNATAPLQEDIAEKPPDQKSTDDDCARREHGHEQDMARESRRGKDDRQNGRAMTPNGSAAARADRTIPTVAAEAESTGCSCQKRRCPAHSDSCDHGFLPLTAGTSTGTGRPKKLAPIRACGLGLGRDGAHPRSAAAPARCRRWSTRNPQSRW